MTSPKVYLEEKLEERAELQGRLEWLERGEGGTHENYQSTTDETKEGLRDRIAELDELIAKVGEPRA